MRARLRTPRPAAPATAAAPPGRRRSRRRGTPARPPPPWPRRRAGSIRRAAVRIPSRARPSRRRRGPRSPPHERQCRGEAARGGRRPVAVGGGRRAMSPAAGTGPRGRSRRGHAGRPARSGERANSRIPAAKSPAPGSRAPRRRGRATRRCGARRRRAISRHHRPGPPSNASAIACGHLEHGVRRAARDVEGAGDRLGRQQRAKVGASDVADVDEVAALAAVLEHAGRAAGLERAAEDARHARVRGVARHPRPVDVVVAKPVTGTPVSRAKAAQRCSWATLVAA